jgi:hypothetical protein
MLSAFLEDRAAAPPAPTAPPAELRRRERP